MTWDRSTRRARLPRDWAQRVAATRTRAHGACEGISLHGEPRWHVDTCNGIGHDCDHDQRGDDHSLANLRWLNRNCHKRKTTLENPATQPNRRPPEAHPGLL